MFACASIASDRSSSFDGLLLRRGQVMLLRDQEIVVDDVAELPIADAGHRPPHREARHEHRDRLADAEDRHERALPITEDVPRGDLLVERHASSERGDPLEQDRRPVRGRLRTQQGGRLLAQLVPCRDPRRQDRARER